MATATAKKILEIDADEARTLFKGLGSSTAKNWDNAELATRLKKLPAKLEAMNGSAKTDDLEKKSKKLLDTVTDAVAKNRKIKVIGGEAEVDDDDDAESDDDEEEATAKKSSGKSSKAKSSKSSGKKSSKKSSKGGEKGKHPGVIAYIRELLEAASKAKPIKKATILKKMVAKFSDREEEQMARTLSTQLSRLEAKKNDNGYWL